MSANPLPNLDPASRLLVEKVGAAIDRCSKTVHADFRSRADHFYSLYRSYSDLRSNWRQAGPSDRDGVLYDAKRAWGAELFIPYSFTVIEVATPRAIAHRPKMLVLPRRKEDETGVEPVKWLIDSQQENIAYELVLQDVFKTGAICGIGWSKTYWRKDYEKRRRIVESTFDPGQYVDGGLEDVCIFDDPDAESLDPYDVFYDPFASDVDSCEWIAHRAWRSEVYVKARLERGQWSSPVPLDDVTLESIARQQAYQEIWAKRQQASGVANFDMSGSRMHEVWEYHDGRQVITILDGAVPVQVAEAPVLGRLPFQVYRPTKVPNQMVGIGLIEPIEHLQAEMNTMRSQRRDNATLALMTPFVYQDGLVDRDDIVIGPGYAIPVNGEPDSVLKQLSIKDIPNSGYQEEAALQRDIERTTGIDDTLAGAEGGGGASETATGVQLVQAAANKRIENMARRLEVEVIVPAAKYWLRLDQHKILENREIRIPFTPKPGEGEHRWAWVEVGPELLAGEYDIALEGGSTQPENTPQKRQDGIQKWQMFAQNPAIDQQMLVRDVLNDFGVKSPEAWIAPPQQVPIEVLQLLVQAGVPEQLVAQAVDQVTQEQQGQSAGEPPSGVSSTKQSNGRAEAKSG